MTAPTGKPRGRPKGCVKTGGRIAGKSLDKNERVKITSAMAGSILSVFERLGGEDFLYRWAKKNETAFVNSCLSRLMPPMPKDGDGDTYNTQLNISDSSPMEAARRVSFLLASAVYQDPSVNTRDISAESVTLQPDAPPQNPFWRPPDDAPWVQEPTDMSSPYDADRARWASEITLTPEERADAALVRETKECTLENYRGNTAEQGGTVRSSRNVERDPRAAQRDRMLQRRRNQLL